MNLPKDSLLFPHLTFYVAIDVLWWASVKRRCWMPSAIPFHPPGVTLEFYVRILLDGSLEGFKASFWWVPLWRDLFILLLQTNWLDPEGYSSWMHCLQSKKVRLVLSVTLKEKKMVQMPSTVQLKVQLISRLVFIPERSKEKFILGQRVTGQSWQPLSCFNA